ncbi:hypothetical protein [Engelhardtia mirabilis]|uniref:Phospholipase C/D domain-containing protein n=1 Tax=Engelhardtia mirabilis TaxID=2528011 RepID=A0A518BE79_9BACT|nr:hypothetical protein Pla133_03450 [Planctomycetes bacterium Pla133]QDU99607.1 hypothetical protein Pla86_03450 [Planctomycetes bacterium Pla86]
MRTPTISTLCGSLLLLLQAAPADAGGSTMHLSQATHALTLIEDAGLQALLADPTNLNAYLNGVNFPDAFNIPPASWYYLADDAHSAWFLTQYAERVRQNPGDEVLLSHFLGTMAHIVGDWRFDRYFLTRVSRQCWPENVAGPWPEWAQEWTDQDLDWLLAWENVLFGFAAKPVSSFVPYDVGHVKFLGDVSVLETAFPGSTPIPWPILGSTVETTFDYVQNEWALAIVAKHSWCYDQDVLWKIGLGGTDDGGRAIAECINRTWKILQQDHSPVFDQYGPWPTVEFSVSDPLEGDLAIQEIAAWIDGPDHVSEVALEDNRIVALEGRPNGVQRLLELNGEVDGIWSTTLTTSDGVAKFALDGDRTLVLLQDGQLILRENALAAWETLGSQIADFDVDGDLLVALVGAVGAVDDLPTTTYSNVLQVRDLSAGDGWHQLLVGVDQFRLEGDRVGVLTRQIVSGRVLERLRVTEDALSPTPLWTDVWSDFHPPAQPIDVSFELDAERIGLLVDGTLSIADGSLGSAFGQVATDVAQFELAGNHVAALGHDQVLSVRTGDGSFVAIHDQVATMQLAGSNPDWNAAPWLAYTLTDGRLFTNRDFKDPGTGSFPTSRLQAAPAFGVPVSAYSLGLTSPVSYGLEGIKLMDRLVVLTDGQLSFQELPPYAPKPNAPIWMSASAGVTANWVQLNWDWVGAGPNDYVALFDQDPYAVGPDGYLPLQWQWATQGPSWESLTKWKAGYYMAYIHEDLNGVRKIVHTAGPTQVALSSVVIEKYDGVTGDWVWLGWTVDFSTAGDRDFVAIYDHDPMGGDPDAHLVNQWQWATSATPWASNTPWAAGYWIGYVQEDVHGNRAVLASKGPTQVTGVDVTISKYAGVLDDYVAFSWSVTDPGASDFVALYDHDPTQGSVDDYLIGQWQWATDGPVFVSGKSWGAGYYSGYVQQDALGNRTLLDTAGPTVCSTPPAASVSMTIYSGVFFYYITLNWSVTNPGPNDYVALYDHYPTTVNGYLAGQWQWATNGPSWVSGTVWASGYYIAYIHEDDCGNSSIIAVSGPL